MKTFDQMSKEEFDNAMLNDFIEHGCTVADFQKVKEVTEEVIKNKKLKEFKEVNYE